jgi:glutamyl-tRNA synthetase
MVDADHPLQGSTVTSDEYQPVRVRYAPSPTGSPHIGNSRTMLFNWFLARRYGGQFIVRIEDSDTARTVPGSVENILEGLRWLGVTWHEGPEVGGPYGPYFQSQRRELYQYYSHRLIESGHAYRCYCSPERLNQIHAEQDRQRKPHRYDRRCRFLSAAERRQYEASGAPFVVRFAMPTEGTTTFHDMLRGPITFNNADIDDMILLKSDGFPTYHLGNVVDDHLMRITHVLRGEEYLSTAPVHVLEYRALGWKEPYLIHLPLILGPDRTKLSKRHGAMSVLEFRDLGYLPEAVINFLMLLGWSYDDKTEILTPDQIAQAFSLDRLGTSASIWARDRLDWMNGVYIRSLSPAELARRVRPFMERPEAEGGLPDEVPRPLDMAYLTAVIRLEQERMKTLAEAPQMTTFFFVDELTYDPALLVGKGMDRAQAEAGLARTLAIVADAQPWTAAAIEAPMRALAADLGLKTGQLFGTVRVAITGRTVSPPLFETMEVLGRECTIKRLRAALERLRAENR